MNDKIFPQKEIEAAIKTMNRGTSTYDRLKASKYREDLIRGDAIPILKEVHDRLPKGITKTAMALIASAMITSDNPKQLAENILNLGDTVKFSDRDFNNCINAKALKDLNKRNVDILSIAAQYSKPNVNKELSKKDMDLSQADPNAHDAVFSQQEIQQAVEHRESLEARRNEIQRSFKDINEIKKGPPQVGSGKGGAPSLADIEKFESAEERHKKRKGNVPSDSSSSSVSTSARAPLFPSSNDTFKKAQDADAEKSTNHNPKKPK